MSNDADTSPSRHGRRHVVIVGGGLAGLTAARHLLSRRDDDGDSSCCQHRPPPLRVTLVEARDRLGGRVRADDSFVPGYPLDVGAEFIHCVDTALTETVDRHGLASRDEWEAYFVSAHADGGPDAHPTRDGRYGMYHVDGRLLMYDDERLRPLSDALEDMMTVERGAADDAEHRPHRSVGEALDSYETLSRDPALRRLAVAGYGNTAGSTDLYDLSLPVLSRFERYWEEHETDGDYRLPARLGMTAVISALEGELRRDERLTVRLNWPVRDVVVSEDDATVVVRGTEEDGETLTADGVICTAAPPLLPALLPTLLTEAQRRTLDLIGMETVCKVILKFRGPRPPWPEQLQSVICADGGPLPELWFRNNLVVDDDGDDGDGGGKQAYHLMVGYLSSGLADSFLKRIETMAADRNTTTSNEVAAQLCLQQLSTVLSVPLSDLRAQYVDTLVHPWNATTEPYAPGGYMYPKTGLTSLAPLAEPCGGTKPVVFLAGEATNAENACCTLQAAMETGIRAADQVNDMFCCCESVEKTTTARRGERRCEG